MTSLSTTHSVTAWLQHHTGYLLERNSAKSSMGRSTCQPLYETSLTFSWLSGRLSCEALRDQLEFTITVRQIHVWRTSKPAWLHSPSYPADPLVAGCWKKKCLLNLEHVCLPTIIDEELRFFGVVGDGLTGVELAIKRFGLLDDELDKISLTLSLAVMRGPHK